MKWQRKWTISPERAKKAYLGRKLKRLNRLRPPKRFGFFRKFVSQTKKTALLGFLAV
jgi:hypothetical protein